MRPSFSVTGVQGKLDSEGITPIFVVGCPRSGTTLVQTLLSSYYEAFTSPQSYFFDHLTPKIGSGFRSFPPFLKKNLPKNLSKKSLERLSISLNSSLGREVIEKSDLIRLEGCSPRVFFSFLSQKLGAKSGGVIYIEKTPRHVFFIPEIKLVFPNAKIINVVRDPRDAFLSFNAMLASQGKAPRSGYEFGRLWRASVCRARSRKLFTITYEDLVFDTEKELRKLTDYLGWDGKGISHGTAGSISESLYLTHETWKVNTQLPIFNNSVGKYKNVGNRREVRGVEVGAGPLLSEFGYVAVDSAKKYFFFWDRVAYLLLPVFSVFRCVYSKIIRLKCFGRNC